MPLSTRDLTVHQRARQVAVRRGKSITTVVDKALSECETRHAVYARERSFGELDALLAELDTVPVADPRSPKEIMDDLYDKDGLLS